MSPRKIISTSPVGLKYTLNITTNINRTSELQNRQDRVNLCMINTDGTVLWHHFVPVLEGVNGNRGSSETLEMYGTDIGQIQSILISPEQGEWDISSIELSTDFQKEFMIKDRNSPCLFHVHDAIETTPFDEQVYQKSMNTYKQIQNDILISTAILTVCGFTLLNVLNSTSAAEAFGFGGVSGLVYQKLLQTEVNTIGKEESHLLLRMYNALNTFASRILALYLLIYIVQTGGHIEPNETIPAFVGFMMNKLALLIVFSKASKN